MSDRQTSAEPNTCCYLANTAGKWQQW